MIQEQYSRISHHTITATGLTGTTLFTVPSTEDFTDDSWSITDLALSEIGVAEGVGRAFIRIGNEIKEFNFSSGGTSSTAGTLNQVLTAGNITGGQDIEITSGDLIIGQNQGVIDFDLGGRIAIATDTSYFPNVTLDDSVTATIGLSADEITLDANNEIKVGAVLKGIPLTGTTFAIDLDRSIGVINALTLGGPFPSLSGCNIVMDANNDIIIRSIGTIFINSNLKTRIETNGGEEDFVFNNYCFKEINIGDWNMDATATLTVAHNLSATEWVTIRNIGITIRNDANTTYYDLAQSGGGNLDSIDNTNFSLSRIATGIFDNTNFDATSYNRGFIRFQYKPD